MADALKARCVLAEVRWRWTLKVWFWCKRLKRGIFTAKSPFEDPRPDAEYG